MRKKVIGMAAAAALSVGAVAAIEAGLAENRAASPSAAVAPAGPAKPGMIVPPPGGSGPAPAATCRIDVRANRVPAAPVAYHLFIVTVWNGRDEYYFRGGPSTNNPRNFGIIKVQWGRYVKGTPDWNPKAKSLTVMRGTVPGVNCRTRNPCFAKWSKAINDRAIKYKATGPNSNSTVYTLLKNCDVPAKKPVTVTPGWGMRLVGGPPLV